MASPELYTNGTESLLYTSRVPSDQFLRWRQAKVVNILPIVVLDSMYMLFGVVGNSVVCYICAFRMKQSAINSLVLSLAVVELLGCVFSIPVDITELINSYWFDYPVLCKIERYFRKFVVLSSGCVLVAIAAERYHRIVKPHKRHVTTKCFRYTILATFIISLIIAIPEAVLSGSEVIKTPAGKGVICSTYHAEEFRGTYYPQLWAFFVVLVYIIFTSAIGAIYFIIASKIWSRAKVQTDRRSRPNTPDSTLQRRVRIRHPSCSSGYPVLFRDHNGIHRHLMPSDVTSGDAPHSPIPSTEINGKPGILRNGTTSLKKENSNRRTAFISELINTLKHKGLNEKQTDEQQQQHTDNPTIDSEEMSFELLSPHILTPAGSVRRRCRYSRKRTTFIMFVMTLTTLLSHLPHIVVVLYRIPRPGLEAFLSPDESVLYYFAWNSYFISLSCHPFVYGFWNGRFKMALSSLWDEFRRSRGKADVCSSSSN